MLSALESGIPISMAWGRCAMNTHTLGSSAAHPLGSGQFVDRTEPIGRRRVVAQDTWT